MSQVKLEVPQIEIGTVIGFGATNARIANSHEGDISGFEVIDTPTQPEEFFGWMAQNVLNSAHDGNKWMVAGFPGPVTPDGTMVGPMTNIIGLKDRNYNLAAELEAADPAISDLLAGDFTLIAVNDGELAAHAAAKLYGDESYNRIAALIIGTGVGAGIVDRDQNYEDVVRANRTNPAEIGHIPLSSDPHDTFENTVSGPALEKRYKLNPALMSEHHPAWLRVGVATAKMAATLGVMNSVELVVPCGGVGGNASGKFKRTAENVMRKYREDEDSAAPLKQFAPDIAYIGKEHTVDFEMHGGESIMRDLVTR